MPSSDSFTARSPEAFARRHPELLCQLREVLAKYPVKAAYLFGSYARGDERRDSDVDVYVQIDRSKGSFGLFELHNLHEDLKQATNKEIGISTAMEGLLLEYAADDLTLIYSDF